MSFKKLIEPLKELLEEKDFEKPLAFQKQILSKIKGGANMFAIAPKGSGKTTSLVISVIQKLQGKAQDEAPRALVLVKDNQAILDLEAEFNAFKFGTDLRVYCANDKRDIIAQRDDIFYGIDILITTPDRLKKLFFANGINLTVLQMFIIEDAEFLLGHRNLTEITRIQESLGTCQYLIISEKYDKRFDVWQERFLCNFIIESL